MGQCIQQPDETIVPTSKDGQSCRCRNETNHRTPRTRALRVEAGLAARTDVENESKRAVERWETTLRAGEVDEGVRREELKAVEKLEVLLKASTVRHRLRTKTIPSPKSPLTSRSR